MYVLVLDDDDDFHGVFQHAKKHSFQVEFFERRLLPNVNRIILARNYINEKRRLWKIPFDIKKRKSSMSLSLSSQGIRPRISNML